MINPSGDPNLFWMSYEDVLKGGHWGNFASLNVCKAMNMHEVRIKGKFLRIQDLDNAEIEQVMSKWYYSVEVE